MKRLLYRNAVIVLVTTTGMIVASGCHSAQTGNKAGDEMNSAMSAQQKATIAEHKKKGEQ